MCIVHALCKRTMYHVHVPRTNTMYIYVPCRYIIYVYQERVPCTNIMCMYHLLIICTMSAYSVHVVTSTCTGALISNWTPAIVDKIVEKKFVFFKFSKNLTCKAVSPLQPPFQCWIHPAARSYIPFPQQCTGGGGEACFLR